MENFPSISIVIPVRNEEKFIKKTIQMIIGQDYPSDKIEILVTDGGSVDRTAEIVSELASQDSRIRLFENPNLRSSTGRNIGVKNATGDIITFIDGHTYIDNNQLLKNTAKLMETEGISILSRPQFLDTPENTFFQKAVALARRSFIGHGTDSTIFTDQEKYVNPTSSGATYKRELFEKIGLFDENFDACEDVEFNYRAALAGYKSFTSIKTAVYYYPRNSLKELFQQLKRYGIGRNRLARKFPSTLSLGTMVPLLITFGIPLLLFLALFGNVFLYLFFVAAGLYLLLIAGWSAGLAFRHGFKFFFVLPAVYVAIHTGLGWGFFRGIFRT